MTTNENEVVSTKYRSNGSNLQALGWPALIRCPSCGNSMKELPESYRRAKSEAIKTTRNYQTNTSTTSLAQDFEASCGCGLLRVFSIQEIHDSFAKTPAREIAQNMLHEGHLEMIVISERYIDDVTRQIEKIEWEQEGLEYPQVTNLTLTIIEEPGFEFLEEKDGSFSYREIAVGSQISFDAVLPMSVHRSLPLPPREILVPTFICKTSAGEILEQSTWSLDLYKNDLNYYALESKLLENLRDGMDYKTCIALLRTIFPKSQLSERNVYFSTDDEEMRILFKATLTKDDREDVEKIARRATSLKETL